MIAMKTNLSRRRQFYKRLASEQRQWIESCGGTLSGYIERYGQPGELRCIGDGGEAIYRADTNALKRYESQC